MGETFLTINVTVWSIQLSLNVLLVMDCVTASPNPQISPLFANQSSVAQRLGHPI